MHCRRHRIADGVTLCLSHEAVTGGLLSDRPCRHGQRCWIGGVRCKPDGGPDGGVGVVLALVVSDLSIN